MNSVTIKFDKNPSGTFTVLFHKPGFIEITTFESEERAVKYYNLKKREYYGKEE